MDRVDGGDLVSDNGVAVCDSAPVRSELLCFVRDKSRIIPYDDLVKVCCDFYSSEEIGAARGLIAEWHKLPKRKGVDKWRSTMEDIVKCLLDPCVHLPVFYAVDLTRLPPTDMKHCDMSAVLIELQGLRNEVRDMKRLQSEVDHLRQELKTVQVHLTGVDSKRVCLDQLDEFPAIPGAEAPTQTPLYNSACPQGANRGSFAQKATELKESGTKSLPRKSQRKIFVGSSTSNTALFSVDTTKQIDVFVSRLHPHSKTTEVEDCA